MLDQAPPHAGVLGIGLNEERANPVAERGDEADNNPVSLGHGDVGARQVFPPSKALLSIQIILREKGVTDARRLPPNSHDLFHLSGGGGGAE